MEGGDPFSEVQSWIRAWAWMGVFESVDRVACQGTPCWGSAAAEFTASTVDASLLGCSTDEVRGSWAASAQGPIHIWIGVWREMGIECAIVDAADPALEIVLASAIAAAQVLPELDAIRTAPRSLQAQ